MQKLFCSILMLSIITLSSCSDDDSSTGGIRNDSGNNSTITFSGETSPVLTEAIQYKVILSGGVQPYKILGSNLGTEYLVQDTLVFTNVVGTTPKSYSINVEDTLGKIGRYSFISSPETVSLDLKDNTFFSADIYGVSDTSGGAFLVGGITYNFKSRVFIFSSSSFTAHDDLTFSSSIDNSGNGSVNQIRYEQNPPPTSPPLFTGTYFMDSTKDQNLEIDFDSLKTPSSFKFDFNVVTNDSLSPSRTLRVFQGTAINLELK